MSSPPAVRIRVGVTGHRDLPQPHAIEEKLSRVFAERLPDFFIEEEESARRLGVACSPPGYCYTIVTSLAEGADRLVAHYFLRYPGTQLRVVLPLSRETYLEDFILAASRAEFDELLRLDPAPVHLQSAHGAQAPTGATAAETRRLAYQAAGRYVVDHCDVVVAIWDGAKARGPGGTTEIINYARRRRRPLVILFIDERRSKIYRGEGLRMPAL